MMSSRRSFRWWSLLLVFSLCLFGSAGAASSSDYYTYHTLSLGSGKPIPESRVGMSYISFRYAMTFNVNRHLISPAFSILARTRGGVSNFGGHTNNFDIGILYGRRLITHYGYFYAGAGVAYVHAVRQRIVHSYYGYNDYAEQIHRIVGVPWDVSAAWTPDESFGLLFQVFGDINRKQSYYGWGVGLHFGG